MATQMLAQAPAVAAAPRALGALLTAAIPGDTGTDWGKGVITWPEAAAGWRTVADCAPAKVDYDYGISADPVGAVPFVIQTVTRCPRIALDLLVERATRQLEAVTSQAMARELWTGDLTRAEPFTLPDGVPFTLANPRPDNGTDVAGPWLNPHLAAAEMLDPVGHPAEAVGAVEAASADKLAGGPLYIHVPVDYLMPLSQFGFRTDGNVMRTPLGSIVVCDAGYPGTNGQAGPPVVYATGPVVTWVGEPLVHSDPASIVELGTNAVAVHAERPALVLFDPQTATGCELTPA